MRTHANDQGSGDFLGPLERRVMRQLWDGGPQTVAELRDAINAGADRRLAHTTVMTTLARLHRKGYADRRGTSRRYTYLAAMDEEALAASIGQRELGRLINRYGAAEIARFAQNLDLDPTLVDRLTELSRRKGGQPR